MHSKSFSDVELHYITFDIIKLWHIKIRVNLDNLWALIV